MLLDSENMPSGLATSRTSYALNSVEKESNGLLMSSGKNAAKGAASVPCVSLRSRFAAEFKSKANTPKSPVRSPLGEIKVSPRPYVLLQVASF